MTPGASDFCPQCYRHRPLEEFISKDGKRFVQQCRGCRDRYQGWETYSASERLKRLRPKTRQGDGYTAALVIGSKNRKLGGIPVSMTNGASCPTSCGLRGRGCYAEYGKTAWHWAKVGTTRGVPWDVFCSQVAQLRPGTLWRHNEAGDLPGRGDELDVGALERLVLANTDRDGFTFTHKPLRTERERAAIATANASGFTINLSADSLAHADELAALGIAPVTVVLPETSPPRLQTPGGREVMVCLNETRGMTCAECRVCAKPTRTTIVGFRAHGQAKALVSELVQLRRKRPAAGDGAEPSPAGSSAAAPTPAPAHRRAQNPIITEESCRS